MKTQLSIFVALVLLLSLSTTTFAQKFDIEPGTEKYETIEKNLLVGVQSDNFGLRTSSAFMLGEMKSEKAVDILTTMLREEDDERARIAAALALIKIGNDRSVYMVQMASKFNEFDRVRSLCKKFYYAHLINEYNRENSDKQILYANLID